jgi:transglutaminase-like putative cysteine protease
VACDEVHVQLPKALPLRFAVTGGKLDPIISDRGDWRTYHWRAVNRSQLPLDENQPSKEELRLQLSVATFGSWSDVLQWEMAIHNRCWTVTPEIREVVRNLTQNLPTPLEKARALTYWLRRHVRYVSVGEKHDYTPHEPAVVFDNRYGDCKDTSQLLAVMLKEAGVPVALASLGVLDDGQVLPAVPSPWSSHAMLLVTLDGQDHWIDTTVSLAGWDQMPRDDRDRLCCVIDDKGLRLLRTPPLTAPDCRVEQTTTVAIQANGSAQCERTAVYSGLAALARRNDWVEIPSGERRRLVAAELQDANSRSRLGDFQLDEAELSDYDRPVHARFRFAVQDQFQEPADQPGSLEGSVCDSTIWAKLLAIIPDYDRQVPLELPTPFESVHRYVIQVPSGFRVEKLPSDESVESKWGYFRLARTTNGKNPQQIELTYYTRINQVRVEPADFEDFRKFREDVAKVYRTWLTLTPVHSKPTKQRG